MIFYDYNTSNYKILSLNTSQVISSYKLVNSYSTKWGQNSNRIIYEENGVIYISNINSENVKRLTEGGNFDW